MHQSSLPTQLRCLSVDWVGSFEFIFKCMSYYVLHALKFILQLLKLKVVVINLILNMFKQTKLPNYLWIPLIEPIFLLKPFPIIQTISLPDSLVLFYHVSVTKAHYSAFHNLFQPTPFPSLIFFSVSSTDSIHFTLINAFLTLPHLRLLS